ncbi:tetratricopeptide repeat protein, partial [Candidatus Fermentibacterales bacterium]|nr:tetratricopeptide repeat protein [Candidatus Fermentibacterales bacterium]
MPGESPSILPAILLLGALLPLNALAGVATPSETSIAFSVSQLALEHSRHEALEVYRRASNCSERSAALEALARLAAQDGESEAAARLLLRAALLLPDDSPDRLRLLLDAADVTPSPDPVLARTLLGSGARVSPFLVLRLGGARLRWELLEMIRDTTLECRDYLCIELADTLLDEHPGDALSALSCVSRELPEPAASDMGRLLHRALLGSGGIDSAGVLLAETIAAGDSELASLMLHDLGIWRLESGRTDWKEPLLSSFDLWPAAHAHSSAYELLRPCLMEDSSLCARVADPFYSGGLWNELYELALVPGAPSHIVYLAARTRDRLGFYDQAISMLEAYLARWPEGADAELAMLYLAIDLGRAGRTGESRETFDRFEQHWPASPRMGNLPWYRGSVLFDSGLYEESIGHFRETITRYRANVTADDAHYYLCMALLCSGHTPEAIEELRRFVSTWPRSVYFEIA